MRSCRFPCLLQIIAAALAFLALATAVAPLAAQWPGGPQRGQFELAEAVQVDEVDSSTRAQMQRAANLRQDQHWPDAIQSLCQLMETAPNKLTAISTRRFVPLREWCQLRLLALPPKALKLYRARVDPLARERYQQGIAERDRASLQALVDQAIASSYGDDALLALSEIALESGDYTAARRYLAQIIPTARPKNTSPLTWPSYPDSNLDLARVRARLVLTSILEGSTDRAKSELNEFARLHPDATGRLGQREGRYVELLGRLLSESQSWPAPPASSDWTTFAGNPPRNQIASPVIDVGAVIWRMPLVTASDAGSPLVAGSPSSPRFYPLLIGDRIFVSTEDRILAIARHTGRPAWGQTFTLYSDAHASLPGQSFPTTAPPAASPRTMTVHRNKLFARMSEPSDNRSKRNASLRPGHVVCLDLEAEGRLLWKIEPEEGWAFEGSPIADDDGVYIAMHRHDVRPQAFVACFATDTGRLRWRTFVCSADTPAGDTLPENLDNLLTLSGQTIYYNTNLGAVASVRTADGRILWLSLYPRELRGDLDAPAMHWRRTSNPCLLTRDTLFVAPADSPRIFALDAAGGQFLWQSGTETEDVQQLLGVAGNYLIAGGRRLYWLGINDEDSGRVKHVWPDGPPVASYASPAASQGRGLLAGTAVLWPARNIIHILDQRSARPLKTIELTTRGISAGNLLTAPDQLIITTENELIAVGPDGGKRNNHRVLRDEK